MSQSNVDAVPAPGAGEPIVHDLSAGSRLMAARATTKLRNALRLNAAYSGVSGLVGVVLASQVASWLGVEPERVALIRLVGAALIVFSASLLVVATLEARRVVANSWGIIVGDVAWVVATAVVIGVGALSTTGVVLAAAVGLVVLDFALVQLRWAIRSRRMLVDVPSAQGAIGRTEVVMRERHMDAPPQRVWPVIADQGLYGQLASNLSAVRVLSSEGEPLVRECSDTSGRSWREECTLWDPGAGFAVDVDTSAPDYPYALDQMQGTWRVREASDGGSVITIAFALRPRAGVKGAAMVLMMHLAFGPILARIFRGWERVVSERS